MTEKFDAVEWFAKLGKTGYADRIRDLTCVRKTVDAAFHAKVDALIEEVRREAYERYDDYRTDPLE